VQGQLSHGSLSAVLMLVRRVLRAHERPCRSRGSFVASGREACLSGRTGRAIHTHREEKEMIELTAAWAAMSHPTITKSYTTTRYLTLRNGVSA
jgi:hypothetical protein